MQCTTAITLAVLISAIVAYLILGRHRGLVLYGLAAGCSLAISSMMLTVDAPLAWPYWEALIFTASSCMLTTLLLLTLEYANRVWRWADGAALVYVAATVGVLLAAGENGFLVAGMIFQGVNTVMALCIIATL